MPAEVLLGVTAAGLFGVTAAGDSSAGRALGKGGNGAGRWWAPVRAIWCNQVKKDEGASCAWTDAAAHSNKDRENVAALNTLNVTRMPLPEHVTTAVRYDRVTSK